MKGHCNRFLEFLHRSLQGHGNSFLEFLWNDIYRLLEKGKTINKYEDDLLQRFVTRTQTKRLHLPKKGDKAPTHIGDLPRIKEKLVGKENNTVYLSIFST